MSDQPAAIQATFADFRLIKGRKQAQLVLEIPIEEADNALAVLGGIPQPQSDCWVAVARLNGAAKPEPKPDKEKQRWGDLNLAMQAGIRCNEVAFRTFLTETETSAFEARSVEDAEQMVRDRCEVDSRKELNLDPEAAERWRRLERSYQAWLKAPLPKGYGKRRIDCLCWPSY
jgi:hypothetical protein